MSFCGLMEIDAEPGVKGIEYQKASTGPLEGVFDCAGITQGRGSRGSGAGSAQYRGKIRISIEGNKARGNDFRSVVLHGGVQDGTRFECFAGPGVSSAAQSG